MSTGFLATVIVVAALASSLCTLALGWIAFRRLFQPQLEARLRTFADLLEARVKAGADAAGQELLEPLRAQVRSGVEDAATELSPRFRADVAAGFQEAAQATLPAFREEVRKGFADAVTSPATTELLDRTARKVVRTGSSLMESGLNLLRGARSDGISDDPPPR